MLHDPDQSHFETDMQQEVSDLLCTGTVEITLWFCVPLGLKILPAIWSFHHKRATDWSILKHKATVCPHGGHQVKGEHFWETNAPVVNWRTVRLVLVLSLLADLKSQQIMLMRLLKPRLIVTSVCPFLQTSLFRIILCFTGTNIRNNSSGYVLQIKKNMHGLCQVNNNWFDALWSSLFLLSFRQSCHDPCLLIHKDCLFLVYVDECIFAKSETVLDDIINALEKDFVLNTSGSIGGYLGIDIRCNSDGTMEITQTGLINKIIVTFGLQDRSAIHTTPATMILTVILMVRPEDFLGIIVP